MVVSILSLLSLGSSPASAGPYIDSSNAGCLWDEAADDLYWWVDAHIYDDDGDVVRSVFQIVDRDGAVLLTEEMALMYADGDYSYWSYDFHEFDGGPECGQTYRVLVDAWDATGNHGHTEYFSRGR